MGSIIKSFEDVVLAQYPWLFMRQLRSEFKGRDLSKKIDGETLKPLFEAYWVACDDDIDVIDGHTSYTEEEINEDLLGKQGVVFGFEGRGLIGFFVLGDGDPCDLENVKGFKIMVKFHLETISAPDCPFVQLRMWDIVDGKMILGETFFSLEGADITAQMLSGGGLEAIAHKGIRGYLPGMEPQE